MNGKRRRVLLVDDGDAAPGIQEMIRTASGGTADVDVFSSYQEVEELVANAALPGGTAPECAILDMCIYRKKDWSGGKDVQWGIEAFKKVCTLLPLERILILTHYYEDVDIKLGTLPRPKIRRMPVHGDTLIEDVCRLLGL